MPGRRQRINRYIDDAAGETGGNVPNTLRTNSSRNERRQGIFWMLTIPVSSNWVPPEVLPQELAWIRGQEEIGSGITEYRHFQVLVAFRRKVSMRGCKRGIINHEPLKIKSF